MWGVPSHQGLACALTHFLFRHRRAHRAPRRSFVTMSVLRHFNPIYRNRHLIMRIPGYPDLHFLRAPTTGPHTSDSRPTQNTIPPPPQIVGDRDAALHDVVLHANVLPPVPAHLLPVQHHRRRRNRRLRHVHIRTVHTYMNGNGHPPPLLIATPPPRELNRSLIRSPLPNRHCREVQPHVFDFKLCFVVGLSARADRWPIDHLYRCSSPGARALLVGRGV